MRKPRLFAFWNWILAGAALLATVAAIDVGAQGGGQGVGNGGGGWVCRNNDTDRSVRWIKTFDLFEAENEWGESVLRNSKPELDQIEDALTAVESALPEFVKKTRDALSIVKRNRHDVKGPIPKAGEQRPVDDIPSIHPDDATCPGGQWERVQLAIMYQNNWLDLDTDWVKHEKFDPTERAALLAHEAVYLVLRDSPEKDPNSIRTRRIVGQLFSTKPPAARASEIEYQLAHPEQGNRDTLEKRDGHSKSLDESRLDPKLRQKRDLLDYYFARLQTAFKSPLKHASNKPLFASYEGLARAVGVDPRKTREAIEKTGPIPLDSLRKQVEALAPVSSLTVADPGYDCVRSMPFAIGLPGGGGWLGIFLHPQLFNSTLSASPSATSTETRRPDRLLSITKDDWMERLVIDLGVNLFNTDRLALSQGTIYGRKSAPSIESLTFFRALSDEEMVGFNVHRHPKSDDYWDGDYLPTFIYCKKSAK